MGLFSWSKEAKIRKENIKRRSLINKRYEFEAKGRVIFVCRAVGTDGHVDDGVWNDLDDVVVCFLSGGEYYRALIKGADLHLCSAGVPRYGQVYKFHSNYFLSFRETYTLIKLSDVAPC
ncbi:hypothetical protein [Candidatus Mycoplasma haematohominis]|uniref:Uncharacterized protein n=1 Tax=Candidatus Mycoplasma haematohominis TaxID=1494318 RepID=A0A478FS41_9MOLU|nr:hypothetical protein [Candidatus Mycoplasma haemohominis]GCE64027.1 hypothetical protein MHSWG343_10350 [Candidatus Mycoplasma haemohominis]